MDSEQAPQANPSGEPSMSFRERKEHELRREQGEPSQPAEPIDDTSPSSELEGEADEQRQPDGTMLEESQDQPEGTEPDAALSEPESDEWTVQAKEWQEKVTAAEDARKSMETDYRRKTHKLSEAAREVNAKAEEVETTAQYFAHQADASLQQFNGIDWAMLRTDPEKFQQAQNAYQQATQQQQQRHAELEKIKSRRSEIESQNQQHIADHSKGVLTHQIPGWGNEVYSKLREFAAKEYDYSEAEFDKIVDWRPIKMMHDAMKAKSIKTESGKVLKKVGQKRGSSAPGTRTAGIQAPRNAQGQYMAAREESMKNPGNKDAFRAMKARQLEAERDRRRR